MELVVKMQSCEYIAIYTRAFRAKFLAMEIDTV